MDLRSLVREALVAGGYDGLYSDWSRCACFVDDVLFPCEEPSLGCECVYRTPCGPDADRGVDDTVPEECEGRCGFHVGPTKPQGRP